MRAKNNSGRLIVLTADKFNNPKEQQLGAGAILTATTRNVFIKFKFRQEISAKRQKLDAAASTASVSDSKNLAVFYSK
jgi:hypothetical protein